MTPSAKIKIEEYKERLSAVLREVATVHEAAELLVESKELTPEEFDAFSFKVEEVFEATVQELEARQQQRKKLKDAINPFTG